MGLFLWHRTLNFMTALNTSLFITTEYEIPSVMASSKLNLAKIQNKLLMYSLRLYITLNIANISPKWELCQLKALCQSGCTGHGHTSLQNHGVFSRTGRGTTRGVTRLSDYTRTSKVQYVTGTSQSVYWECDGNLIIVSRYRMSTWVMLVIVIRKSGQQWEANAGV